MIVFVSFNNVYDIDIREKKNPIPLILHFHIEGNQLDIQQYLKKQTEKTYHRFRFLIEGNRVYSGAWYVWFWN